MKKILLILFLLLLSPVYVYAKDTAKNLEFKFFDRPVKPACLALFNSTKDNYPYVKAIDLWRCQFGEALPQKTHKNDQGYYYFFKNNKNKQDGLYSYKLMGVTSNGIYVVHTYNDDGHSTPFDMLLFLQLQKAAIPVYDGSAKPNIKSTTYAVLLGYAFGGSHCTGGIKSVKVKGNNVTIVQYPKKNSANQCEGDYSYTINLAKYVPSIKT